MNEPGTRASRGEDEAGERRRHRRGGPGGTSIVTACLAALALLTGSAVGATAATASTSSSSGSTGALSGRITASSVAAVIGEVCVSAKGPSSGSAVSSNGGTFTISHLAPGSYTVTADPTCGGTEPSNFQRAHRSAVIVKSGATTTKVDLALSPVRPAKEIGVVPPAEPESNCTFSGASSTAALDECRAREGVGPVFLPSNYGKLSGPEQMLVLLDIERVNRGLPPVVGLSAPLDADAEKGAKAGDDPTGPSGYSWGSIWAGGLDSVASSDWGWMYDDGYPGPNEDCSSPSAAGCWGHRDNILLQVSQPVVGGGGLVTGSKAPYGYSAAFLFVIGYPTSPLVFSWSNELKYFKARPRLEPLAAPTVAGISPAKGTTSGSTTVHISGAHLLGARAVDFGRGHAGKIVSCSETSCTVRSPRGTKGTVNVTVTTAGGTSAVRPADRFTYD